MSCHYHPDHPAAAACQVCSRPLCPACDHRIKGAPCCQDCILAGIELIQAGRGPGASSPPFPTRPPATSERIPSPWLAVLFALFPGFGAVYNRQHVKALLQFLTIAGLLSIADLVPEPLDTIFGLSATAAYLFTLFDGYGSALQARLDPTYLRLEDERLRARIHRHPQLIGLFLLLLGAVALLASLQPQILERFWPLLLVGAGALWILQSRQMRTKPD
jgi:hypothetical protein